MRIVLVETSGALNLGAIARVMQNFGLSELVLVNPLCSPTDPQAKQMAVHAQAILAGAKIVPSLLEGIGDCDRVIATAGRIDRGDRPLLSLVEGCQWLMAEGQKRAIVFGREDRGLSNQELQQCSAVMTIPTVPESPSLNLAQAVGISCYQLQQQQCQPTPTSTHPFPTTAQIEATFQELEELLLSIGFLYPHTAFSRMEKIRAIFQKRSLNQEELTILRGILRQIKWATGQGH